MAVAPALPWRKASAELLRDRLFWPAWAGVGTLVLSVALGATGVVPLVAFGLAGFAGGAAIRQIVLATRRQGWRGFVGRANGGMVVHLGVVIVAVAIAASGSYASQGEFRLSPGDTASVAGHEVEYLGLDATESAEKTETQARVRIDGGDVYAPALSQFVFGGQSVGTPSVQSGPTGDVYLSLIALPEGGTEGEAADGEIVLRVIVEPLAVWLWIGGGVIAVGTILAAFPGRRRKGTDPVSAPVPERLERTRRGSGEDEPEAEVEHDDDREPVGAGSTDGAGT
jgi:cytochrome c-type biogenesis protein CcmF